MLKKLAPAISAVCVLFLSNSSFAVEPSLGASAAVSIAREILSAPPLPNLEGGKSTVTPQIGYASVKKNRSTSSPGSVSTSSGELKGPTAGLALTVPSKGDFGFFVFAIGSQVSGEMRSYYNGDETEVDRDIKGEGYSAVAGISYRLIGDEKSAFALGIFAGPAYTMVRSSQTIQLASGTYSPTKIRVDPTFLSAYEGLQLKVRLGGFLVNPYFVLSQDLGDKCQKIDVESGTVPFDSFTCEGKPGHLELDSTLFGVGVFLGYGPLRLNAFSQNITKMLDETAATYTLSYSFEL